MTGSTGHRCREDAIEMPLRESHTEVGGLVEASKVHNLYFVMFPALQKLQTIFFSSGDGSCEESGGGKWL